VNAHLLGSVIICGKVDKSYAACKLTPQALHQPTPQNLAASKNTISFSLVQSVHQPLATI